MEKYINFPMYVGFMPMWNPIEMLDAGIRGGKALTPLSGNIDTVKELFPRIAMVTKPLEGKSYRSVHNYFKVKATHPNFDWDKWFRWYIEFYFNQVNRTGPWESDRKMIALWVRQLWYIWDDILETTDPLTKRFKIDDTQKQALLELAWNYEYKPNFDKEWMLTRFPLIP